MLEKLKQYITRSQGNCWIRHKMLNGNMKMVTRYTDEMLFCCEYDGKSMGDEFDTKNVDEALKWLYT